MKTFSEKRVDFFPVGEGFPNENYFKNGEILREGVQDCSCLYLGKVGENFAPEVTALLINDWGEYISSVEFYSNGAMNCFVRYNNSDNMAHCVILVRPQS